MRIAIVAESFLPHINGVTGSVLRTMAHVKDRGHEVVVLAAGHGAPVVHDDVPILHLPSFGLPVFSPIVACVRAPVSQPDRQPPNAARVARGPDIP